MCIIQQDKEKIIMLPEEKYQNANPYLEELNREVADILKKDVSAIRSRDAGMKHINADNDWIMPEMARMALVLGFAWKTPQSDGFRRQEVWDQCVKLIRRVIDSCRKGKWWREDVPGTGDDNINRFTLISVTDLYLRIGPYLDEELRKKYLLTVEQAAAVQINDYDNVKNRSRGQYPNMDAYFMLIMEETSRILSRSDCHELAMKYLGHLENCLFDGGGFVYFLATNECECYHQLIVMTLVRLWELTRSRRVLDLLRKTLPYYPNTVEPSGVVEYYTDPYWKHTWDKVAPYALDALATLFPDAPEADEHRYLAHVARQHQKKQQNGMFLVWAMEYWRPESGTKPCDSCIRYDPSIRGPRGRFGTFSWGGTMGACQDTFVGAMVAHSADKYSALQAVGIDILLAEPPIKEPESAWYGRRLGTSAYVSGCDYLRRLIVTEKMACLAVRSPVFGGGIGWNHLLPESGWQMRQVWFFDPHRVIGMLVVDTASANCSPARELGIYARLGGSDNKVEERNGMFICGDISLRVVASNLRSYAIKPAYRFCMDNDFKSTELILSENIGGKTSKSYMALMEIFPTGSKPADIVPLASGALSGFKVSAQNLNMTAAFNAGNSAVAWADLEQNGMQSSYRTVTGSPCSRLSNYAAIESVGPSELILAQGNVVGT